MPSAISTSADSSLSQNGQILMKVASGFHQKPRSSLVRIAIHNWASQDTHRRIIKSSFSRSYNVAKYKHTLEGSLFPVVIGVIGFLVIVVVVSRTRRGAQSARKGIEGGDLEVFLDASFPDSASHHHKHCDHHGQAAQPDGTPGHGHHAAPDVTHHDAGSGSFHDSSGHSGFDGGGFHGGHH